MKKKCSKCERTRKLRFFNKDPRYRMGVKGWCKDCEHAHAASPKVRAVAKKKYHEKMKDPVFRESEKIRNRKRYHANPRKRKDQVLRARRGGVSLVKHERTKRCLLCKRKRRVLDADHNHKTNKYRGAICRKCNLMIAMVESVPNGIKKIRLYLKRGL